MYASITLGKSPGDPQVTDTKAIKYTPNGIKTVKTRFDDDFQELQKKVENGQMFN